jgi:hypothetical protein
MPIKPPPADRLRSSVAEFSDFLKDARAKPQIPAG